MARLNIEDEVFKDIRFYNLVLKLGSVDHALGALVRAWILGQKWHLLPEKTIPMDEWKKQHISDSVIHVGLAHIEDNRVRISGAAQHFAWLVERRDTGRKGGLKSAETRRANKLKLATAELEHSYSKRKQIQPSYSFSFSSFSKEKEYISGEHSELKQSSIKSAIEEWRETLLHFGIQKSPSRDEVQLAKLIQARGLEDTLAALRGFRFEQKTEGFDPGKHCYIGRLQKPQIFEKLCNLGNISLPGTSSERAAPPPAVFPVDEMRDASE